MGDAGHEYSDLQHDAECWRTLRRRLATAAEAIERPGADRLSICLQMLLDIDELRVADTQHGLARTAAALHAIGDELSQPQLEHRARTAVNLADDSVKPLTLIMAALGEGQEGRWPSLFPPQVATSGGQLDINYASLRGHLAALLEYARQLKQLKLFGTLTEAAELLAAEANRLGGLAGDRIKGQDVMNWRQQVRSKTTPEHDLAKKTYRMTLEALVVEPEQPKTKSDAIHMLRSMVRTAQAIDPRRSSDKH
jgi:hypothetical protein